MKRKVVVTGIGLTTSLGIGVNQNWKAALKNKTAIRPIQSLDTSTLRTHLGAEVAIDFNAYFPNINTNRLDRSTLLGLLTAQEAIQDAQLTPKECAQTGVFIGTCFSTVQTKEATYLKLATSETGISPLIFIKSMDNAAGGEIAIQFGLKGINQTISTACSSSAMALGEAYRLIQSGYAERILVGGLDTPITRFTIRGWERLHLISDAKKSNALKSPFSKNRNGFVLGEGAGFLLLESEKAAQKRGSKIYASLVGFGTNCDAKHLSTPDSLSQSQSILLALKEAKLAPKDIH